MRGVREGKFEGGEGEMGWPTGMAYTRDFRLSWISLIFRLFPADFKSNQDIFLISCFVKNR